jgi:hypothetical protein
MFSANESISLFHQNLREKVLINGSLAKFNQCISQTNYVGEAIMGLSTLVPHLIFVYILPELGEDC